MMVPIGVRPRTADAHAGLVKHPQLEKVLTRAKGRQDPIYL